MVDFVIPLGKSKTDWLDLRYCLRALEKFGKGLGNLYIIGEKPSWIKNVTHHYVSDNPKQEWKERNIYLKTKFACELTDVSENFFFCNDDHVLLQEVDIENYPYYSKGTCYGSMLKNKSHYRATMNHTRKWLEANGHEDFNADGHCPIIFNKKEFLETFTDEMWEVPFGYGMKTIYCAKNNKPMEFMKDCKFHARLTKEDVKLYSQDRHVISFSDGALKTGISQYLEELLPNKSIYER